MSGSSSCLNSLLPLLRRSEQPNPASGSDAVLAVQVSDSAADESDYGLGSGFASVCNRVSVQSLSDDDCALLD